MRVDSVTIGDCSRITGYLEDEQIFLCSIFPFGSIREIWVKEITISESKGRSSFLSCENPRNHIVSEQIIPFGSVVVFGETP